MAVNMSNMDDNSERTIVGAASVHFTDSEATIRDSRQRFRAGDLILKRYEVLEELGQGGMGVVYRCLDRVSGTEVAVKALPPELSHSVESMEDIRDNFQLVHSLIHQNIAACLTLDKDDRGDYYLVMEMVHGRSLALWIRRRRREGALSLEAVLPILRQVALALDFAHRKHVMHRDVKPANIMVEDDGTVKVLDFGIAAQIRSTMSRISMAFTEQSGTRQYKAPEQWRSRPQGAATDQYALAVTAYEMLSGRLPFDDDDPAVLREMVLKEQPLPIEGMPDYANSALLRALAKEPGERFASCSDFVQALGGEKKAEHAARQEYQERQKQNASDKNADDELAVKKEVENPEAKGNGTGAVWGVVFLFVICLIFIASSIYNSKKEDDLKSVVADVKVAIARTKVIQLPKGVELELIKVDVGDFMMGSPSTEEGRDSDETQHRVYINERFWLGKYEVTQEQYQAVMGKNPSYFKGTRHPVEIVTWHEAMDFCKELTRLEREAGRLPEGYEYTLPTEEQWEYAARGGNKSNGYKKYSGGNDLDAVGWCDGNSGGATHPVGGKSSNELGFCDMSGNVWEWCWDSCEYNAGVVTVPSGSRRVIRGGSWNFNAGSCRVALRLSDVPGGRDFNLGFRVALAPSK